MAFFKPKSKKTIRAREFVLENADGEERAALRTDEEGNAFIGIRDPQGATRVIVGVTQGGMPRVCLHYAEGKGSIQLEASDELNTAALTITGPGGLAQVMLGVAANGLPAIALFDQEGNLLFPHSRPSGDGDSDADPGVVDWDSILRD